MRGIVFRSEAREFKLGVSAAAFVPTGNKFSFGGDQGAGGEFGMAAEYDAKIVAVTLDAAYRLRPTAVVNELVVSSEVDYRARRLRPAQGRHVPRRPRAVRRRGGQPLEAARQQQPARGRLATAAPATSTRPRLEWMLDSKAFFTASRHVYAGLGFGSRLDGGYAPDFRTVAVIGGSFGIAGTAASPGVHAAGGDR